MFSSDNALTGSINTLFNPSSQKKLSNIDVSRNSLSGGIDASIFELPSLTSFAAVSNCIDLGPGGLSSLRACAAIKLQALILDGLSASPSCQDRFFPRSQRLNSYSPKFQVVSTIPVCLFAMPSLQTLHLSGNGIRGSLESDLQISPSMRSLSVSYNQLVGNIPRAFQQHTWSNIDLSYNKLTGKGKATNSLVSMISCLLFLKSQCHVCVMKAL